MKFILYATVHGTVLHYTCTRVRHCAHDGNIMTDLVWVLTIFMLRLVFYLVKIDYVCSMIQNITWRSEVFS